MLTTNIYFFSFLGPNKLGNTTVKTKVLNFGEVSGGDAATLYDTILRVIRDEKRLPTNKLASFTSDGAPVMTGELYLLLLIIDSWNLGKVQQQ